MSGPRYRTIVADPPWDYGSDAERWVPNRGMKTRLAIPYDALTLEEIVNLPVGAMAEADSCLWLWATNRFLPDSFKVMAEWGFTYKQTLVWNKEGLAPFGGSVCPNGAEFLVFGKRGKPTVGRSGGSSVMTSPRATSHSRKPERFLDFIEAVSPGPYLELFARRNRLGWDTWGNEALNHVEVQPGASA